MIQPDALPNGYGGTSRTTRALRFVAADGSPDSVPADIPLDPSASFIGWRGDSVVVWDGVHLTAIPVNGGPPTTLADTGSEVSAAQFASGLLSTATVVVAAVGQARAQHPDRTGRRDDGGRRLVARAPASVVAFRTTVHIVPRCGMRHPVRCGQLSSLHSG
jgi:hypothetical protein